MSNVQINQISIVIPDGAKTYYVGQDIDGREVAKIEVSQLYFQGDPFDHYCGYDSADVMLFSIHCHIPCEITYKPKQP